MAPGYRLVSYSAREGTAIAGVLVDGRIVPATDILGADAKSVIDILRDWDGAHRRLDAAAQDKSRFSKGVPLSEAKLHAPVLYPGAFYCAGANYWDHLAEMAEIAERTTGKRPSMEKPAEPWFFMKSTAGTIIGDGATVHLPVFSKAVDWEAELGVVIGRPTRNISEADALSAVAGYLIVNDLSARDVMKREGSPFVYDWIGQKCFDDGAPMGPWLTPAAYVSNPSALDITLSVNGVTKQDSNTSKMVHGIAEQVAYLSRHVTLQPGDIIATGTPSGVGMPKGEFLKAGDTVKIEISELGALQNPVVATPPLGSK